MCIPWLFCGAARVYGSHDLRREHEGNRTQHACQKAIEKGPERVLRNQEQADEQGCRRSDPRFHEFPGRERHRQAGDDEEQKCQPRHGSRCITTGSSLAEKVLVQRQPTVVGNHEGDAEPRMDGDVDG